MYSKMDINTIHLLVSHFKPKEKRRISANNKILATLKLREKPSRKWVIQRMEKFSSWNTYTSDMKFYYALRYIDSSFNQLNVKLSSLQCMSFQQSLRCFNLFNAIDKFCVSNYACMNIYTREGFEFHCIPCYQFLA